MGERELPEGWEWKRLEECCQIIRGISFPSNSKIDHFQEGFFACLRTANIQEEVEIDDLWFIPEQFVKNERQLVKKFDILISSANSLNLVGKVALVRKLEYKTTLGAFISLLRSNSIIDPKFLYYYLSSNEFKRFIPFIASTTTNISNISMTKLAAFKMVVPPLSIQHRIVAMLEQAEAVKRQRQEADALTVALLQSVFYEMFGDPVKNEMRWEVKQLDEVCPLIRDGEHRTPTYIDEGIPFITAKNLVGNSINFENTDKISPKEHVEFSKRAKPEMGDLLMTKDGTIGVTQVIKEDTEFSIYVSVVLLKLNHKIIHPDFLNYLLSSDEIQNEIRKRTKGIAIRHIHLIDLRSLKIPLPPLTLQQQFARVVESVERIRERQVASGKEIEGLCEGLMARAFGGELAAN
jgi:type I restriction enzyme, S subunit